MAKTKVTAKPAAAKATKAPTKSKPASKASTKK
jgi:hypothetical protein